MKEYEPYGPEWEKEMMKWRKKELINAIREQFKNQHFFIVVECINGVPILSSVPCFKNKNTALKYMKSKKKGELMPEYSFSYICVELNMME